MNTGPRNKIINIWKLKKLHLCFIKLFGKINFSHRLFLVKKSSKWSIPLFGLSGIFGMTRKTLILKLEADPKYPGKVCSSKESMPLTVVGSICICANMIICIVLHSIHGCLILSCSFVPSSTVIHILSLLIHMYILNERVVYFSH